MKKYEVKVKFIFEGVFQVNAYNKDQARDNVEKHCGLVMGGNIHTTLEDKNVDWNFGIHPKTEIVSVKQIIKNNLK